MKPKTLQTVKSDTIYPIFDDFSMTQKELHKNMNRKFGMGAGAKKGGS